MRRVVLVGLLALSAVAVVLLLVSANDDDRRGHGAEAAGAGPSSSTRATTTTTTRPRRGSGQAVTLMFAGDTHFEGGLRTALDHNQNGMFAPIAPTLGSADLAMVNLETAIATGGTPDPKAFNFRAPPSAFEALRVAGIDAVTMANNHGRDYGPAGLAETLAAKAQTPMPVLGVGANAEEAYRPWRTQVKGQQIAVFAATDVLDEWLITPWTATDTQGGLASTKGASVDRLVRGIRDARADADTIIVFLHWGVEGATCPSARQEELAQQLIDAGGDIIVGSHSHRVMTGGRHGTAFVDYGLGNFAFYNESGASGVSGVLKLTVTGRDVDAYEWIPARIQGGVPHPITGSAADADRAAFTARQSCAGLTP